MARNAQIGNWGAVVFGGFVAVSASLYAISRRGAPFPICFLGMLVLHPAWTVGVRSGDCGIMLGFFSYLLGGIGGMALCGQIGFTIWIKTHHTLPDDIGDYYEGPGGAIPDGRAEPTTPADPRPPA